MRGERLEAAVRQQRRVVGTDAAKLLVGGVRLRIAVGGEQHHRQLPDVAVDAGSGGLLAHDRIRLPQDVEALARHRAHDADREARAGERVAHDHRGRQAELGSDGADLVLEQRAQRLDEIELEVVGEPGYVQSNFVKGYSDMQVQLTPKPAREQTPIRVEATSGA